MVESSIDNPNSPAALLHKLCCRLLGKENDLKGTIQRIDKPTCSFETNITAKAYVVLNMQTDHQKYPSTSSMLSE